ncbi:uncharacterized protein LOC122433820 [Cervus canadensis]|uniref:uncharacterized protein LOC122433820 n=1 Tax=Cervus canadensis TaxID=1574408 RepID=UPI001CA34F8A|nr:uncharacterized protein LOC122433820 [Cervus canadensis]
MRLGVTAVTKELQWAERQRRGVGGASRGSAPGGGELRAEDGLDPSGRPVAVPVALEPERPLEAPVGSARWGPADARNLQPTCLPICPPTRRSGAGSCAPKGPGKTCPGVWVPSGPCLRLPALGRGYGRGVLRLLFSREESAPSPPQPSLQLWRPVLRKVLETKPVSVIRDPRAPQPLPPWKEKVPKGCWVSSMLHPCKPSEKSRTPWRLPRGWKPPLFAPTLLV